MVELFFILYYIPKTMTRLARKRNRSAIVWSLIGIGAWLAGELLVLFIFGAIYGMGMVLLGWPQRLANVLQLFIYVAALAGAGGSLILAERILDRKSKDRLVEPPPPQF